MKTEIKNAPKYGKGEKGLYVKIPIKKGHTIVKMNKNKIKSYGKKRWEKHIEKRGLPHDSGIIHLGKYWSDWRTQKPRWYRINHSKNPTAEMKWKHGAIHWVALRDLSPGQEVTFTYRDAPWD